MGPSACPGSVVSAAVGVERRLPAEVRVEHVESRGMSPHETRSMSAAIDLVS